MTKNTTIIVGLQAGDEGKGKILSYLALKDNPKIVARSGGPNAGHTVIHEGITYAFRHLPSGTVNKRSRILLGPGALINPVVLLSEIEKYKVNKQKLGVDGRATVITEEHIQEDSQSELSDKIGTTKTGCGPAATARVRRSATLVKDCEALHGFTADVALECNLAESVLIEGTQGFMLSNLYGEFPYVTSKDTTASTLCADIGIGPTRVKDVIAVIKSYTTRVGNGTLINEMSHQDAVNAGWDEYGTVTGRKRRVSAYLDFNILNDAVRINGATQIALTKLDSRFSEVSKLTKWSELSSGAKAFIKEIENNLNTPITLIGTGPSTEDIIDRR